jgi:electron transport complex protein RnfG
MKQQPIQWVKPPKAEQEPSSTRLVLTMAVAGFLSGLLTISIYLVTLPTITAYKIESLRQAVFRVLPNTVSIQEYVYRDGQLRAVKDGEKAKDEASIYGGFDIRQNMLGYAIAAEGAGFQDTIRLLYGYDKVQKRIVGMEVLDSRETPGLGDKIYKDLDFVANFKALNPLPEIKAVKKGQRTADNQIDAITGATISSVAIVKIINQSNALWLPRIHATHGHCFRSLSC